jgi:hypothetical protein
MSAHTRRRLLGVGTDSKTVKGQRQGILTGILYLTPSDLSGKWNLCRFASAGCRATCLFSAGRGAFSNVLDGDLSDARFLDRGNGPGPYVIGLRAKGKAINDRSGFVIHPDTLAGFSPVEKLRAMRADRMRKAIRVTPSGEVLVLD